MCRIEVRIAYTAFGLLTCLSASVLWEIQYRNTAACVCAALGGVYAGFLLVLHVLHWRGRLDTWNSTHFLMAVLSGSVGQLAGLVSIIAFIALGIVNQTDFGDFYGDNWWLAIVWAWMLWKWAFGVFWYARKYRKELESDYVLGADFRRANPQHIVIHNDTQLSLNADMQPKSY